MSILGASMSEQTWRTINMKQHSQPCSHSEDVSSHGKQTWPPHDFWMQVYSMSTCPTVGLWWLFHVMDVCVPSQHDRWHGGKNEITCTSSRNPLRVYVEGCVRLMRCSPHIANMAHFYETDRPCFTPVVPLSLIIKSSMSNLITIGWIHLMQSLLWHQRSLSTSVHCLSHLLTHVIQGVVEIFY